MAPTFYDQNLAFHICSFEPLLMVTRTLQMLLCSSIAPTHTKKLMHVGILKLIYLPIYNTLYLNLSCFHISCRKTTNIMPPEVYINASLSKNRFSLMCHRHLLSYRLLAEKKNKKKNDNY